MTINFDLVIETTEDSVDMKAGLESMQGVSDALRCVAESVLTGKTPQRQTHKSKVRTSLKKSFKGSYGQIFSVDIYDDKLNKKLKAIGRPAFSELISYFISESLYMETRPLSARAKKTLDELGEQAESVVNQLRVSALENIHQISLKFNHDVKVRYRKSRNDITTLANFNRSTAKSLEAETSTETVDLNVIITRLNIHTGNGRLQVEGQDETVAFGFGMTYRDVKLEAKKVFSENLNHNNGIKPGEWRYIKISASPVRLKDGRVVKHIVKGFYEN